MWVLRDAHSRGGLHLRPAAAQAHHGGLRAPDRGSVPAFPDRVLRGVGGLRGPARTPRPLDRRLRLPVRLAPRDGAVVRVAAELGRDGPALRRLRPARLPQAARRSPERAPTGRPVPAPRDRPAGGITQPAQVREPARRLDVPRGCTATAARRPVDPRRTRRGPRENRRRSLPGLRRTPHHARLLQVGRPAQERRRAAAASRGDPRRTRRW